MQTRWTNQPATEDVLAGAAAGLVAGLVGAWAMNRFHALASRLSETREDQAQQSGQDEPGDAQAIQRGKQQGEGPATVLAAERLSRGLLHHELSQRERDVAGPLMHYGFGAGVGAFYGAAAEVSPTVQAGGGTAYGLAVWLAADEMVVPALGLSEGPTKQPLRTHLSGLGAHVVFGLVLEPTRRALRTAVRG